MWQAIIGHDERRLWLFLKRNQNWPEIGFFNGLDLLWGAAISLAAEKGLLKAIVYQFHEVMIFNQDKWRILVLS